jgi:hypothetical protein
MSNRESRAARSNLKPVADGAPAAPAKEKKPRKARASGGTSFASQARALVEQHRGKLDKLRTAESKAETKLATIRAQREAAEGPLREVEEILAKRPELPGLESDTASPLPVDPSAPTEAPVDVNQ